MHLCHGQSPYSDINIILISGKFRSVGLVKHKNDIILIREKEGSVGPVKQQINLVSPYIPYNLN